jgi:hypothetical protein
MVQLSLLQAQPKIAAWQSNGAFILSLLGFPRLSKGSNFRQVGHT